MLSTIINLESKFDASDVENSPRSTSAGGASTPSTEPSPRRDVSSENLTTGRESRDREFEALDAELADCEGEGSLPVAGLSASQAGIPKVPEREKFIVKNTFIEELLLRPESLEGFFSERRVLSCPATRQHTADNDDPLEDWNPKLWEEGSSDAEESHEIFNTGSPRFSREEAICIRNTFIHALVSRSESLEAFLQERRVQSCPNTARGTEQRTVSTELPAHNEVPRFSTDDFEDNEVSVTSQINTATIPMPAGAFELGANLPWGASALPIPIGLQRLRAVGDAFMKQMGISDNSAASGAPGSPGTGPGMQSALPPPPAEWAPTAFEFGVVKPPPLPTGELGSEEMPTVGSLLHCSGQCQPCGFFHTKGCSNGARCAFCHLCTAGEVKRRRRVKREQFREAREAAVLAAEKVAENLDIAEILKQACGATPALDTLTAP